jgi:hypothetical protein
MLTLENILSVILLGRVTYVKLKSFLKLDKVCLVVIEV